ncbi:helix-turn-helix transcriptional regulator [Lachnospiraceae bacterium 45-W7]
MPMNLVIQKKRKELGLTQEQVARYLDVSIPAVSKWESGLTCPDISLLPSLARLLKIDLNTLFCFQEVMTKREISCFCKEIMDIAQTRGIAEGFEAAEKKIHEYPHDETLLQCLTFQLDGLLRLSGLPPQEKIPYDDILLKWYRRLAASNDSKIRNSANYMMAGTCIRKGEYDMAQQILDLMPDKEDITSSIADKRMLQVLIYQGQGKSEEAVIHLQNALLTAVNKVQMLLLNLVDAELASGNQQNAANIADKAAQMPYHFDLEEYIAFMAPLQIAVAEQNVDACIELMRKMFQAMLMPGDMSGSPLFYHIAKSSNPKQILSAVLGEVERDPVYSFLQASVTFKELISEYKALIKL